MYEACEQRLEKDDVEASWNALPVAAVTVDAELRARQTNAAWGDLVFEPAASLRDEADWLGAFEADDRPRIASRLREAMRTDGRATVRSRMAGTGRWVEVRADARLQGPRPDGLVVVVLDIRAHKAREAALAFDALHDPLTGLYNRVALIDRAEQAVARLERSSSHLAVAFIDLDRFKEVNDRHGHGVGDRVLVAAARRLVDAIRPTDTLARIGGDEFVALCEGLDGKPEACGVARRLVAAVSRPIVVGRSVDVRLSATVGIAFATGHRDLPSDLIERADQAMYRAREQGSESALVGATA